jgi:hypothetical protein
VRNSCQLSAIGGDCTACNSAEVTSAAITIMRKRSTVVFRQFQHNNPNRQDYISMPTTSGKDGAWKLTAPTSRGLLLCTAPGKDFLTSVVGSTELLEGRPGGDRRYYDCVIALDLKPQKKPKEVPVTLRRGVTLRCKLVGPDGKPVRHAVIFGPGELLRSATNLMSIHYRGNIPRVLWVKDGTFELHRCDPDRTYRVYVLNNPGGPRHLRGSDDVPPDLATNVANLLLNPAKGRLGAAVDISAKQAKDQPLTIKLQPCVSAEMRFVDARGKPAHPLPRLEMEVSSGRGPGKAHYQPEAMVLAVSTPWDKRGDLFRPDAKGRLTVPALIPGATYRLKAAFGPQQLYKEFRVQAGKLLKLGDMVVDQAQ